MLNLEAGAAAPVLADHYLRAAGLFFVLGDPARLRVLALLESRELCVSEIAGYLDEEMSTVSHRMRLLRFSGLVVRRKAGKHVFYKLADAHVADIVRSGLQHANEGVNS